MEHDFEPIGCKLKTAREAAGWVVDDVVFRTRIPRSVVEALEGDDFSAFSSPIYAKSFLSQYSDYLNVDARAWLDALEPGNFVPEACVHPVVEAPELSVIERTGPADTRGGIAAVLGLFALSAALVVVAVKSYEFFESRFGNEPAPRAETPMPESRPQAPPLPSQASVRVDRKPLIMKEDEELGKPPPRAIIVR